MRTIASPRGRTVIAAALTIALSVGSIVAPGAAAADEAAYTRAVYRTLLGRDPDPAGAAYFGRFGFDGGSRLAAAISIVHSREYQSAFYRASYLAIVGQPPARIPTDDSLADPRIGLALYVLSSRSGDCDPCFVRGLYRTALGREADSGGLDYWSHQLSLGYSRETIVGTFYRHPELVGRIARFTSVALLGRPPRAGEITGTRPGNIAAEVLASDEFFARFA